MKNSFDPFEFQLNLGGSNPKSINQKKFISVMISPQTNIQQVAQNICMNNNIGMSLIEVIAEAIYDEIEKQIVEKQQKMSISRKKSYGPNDKKSPSPYKNKSPSPSANNKTKKFKNRFCSYLKQSPAKQANINQKNKTLLKQTEFTSNSRDVQTFRDSEHFINPSSFNPSDQEYSFRPSCLQTMDLTNNSFQNSLQITEPSVINISRCSYSTNNTIKNGKKSSLSKQKLFRTKKERTVFDNLYQHSILLNMKKENDRKKSFEKLTFKPELNPMSKKIIHKIMQNNPEHSKSQKAIYFKTKVDPIIMNKGKAQQKSLSKSKGNKQNITPQKSVSASRKTQKSISIYERGVLFRKKSQDKLSRMKEREFYDEIKSCSFQPTFFSRKSPHHSRIA